MMRYVPRAVSAAAKHEPPSWRALDDVLERLRELEAEADATRARGAQQERASASAHEEAAAALAQVAAELAQLAQNEARLRAQLEEARSAGEAWRQRFELAEARRASPRPAQASAGRLPLDAYPLRAVPGLTAAEADALARAGVRSSAQLAHADPLALSRASGVPVPRLARLCALASLAMLRGVGTENAEALYRAGLRAWTQLRGRDARAVALLLARGEAQDGVTPEARARVAASREQRAAEIARSASSLED